MIIIIITLHFFFSGRGVKPIEGQKSKYIKINIYLFVFDNRREKNEELKISLGGKPKRRMKVENTTHATDRTRKIFSPDDDWGGKKKNNNRERRKFHVIQSLGIHKKQKKV